MLLTTTTEEGKALLAGDGPCLYVRQVELHLADGQTLTETYESQDAEDGNWVLAVPPDPACVGL